MQAPGVRLRFLPKPDKDSTPLRDGTVDLETGVVEKTTGPEVRTQALFRDRYVGVVRPGHPLARGKITAARYAAGRHISVSRRGLDADPIDETLAPLGRNERRPALAVQVPLANIAGAVARARECLGQRDRPAAKRNVVDEDAMVDRVAARVQAGAIRRTDRARRYGR